MDELIARLEFHAMFESNELEDDLCDAIATLRKCAEREKELVATLVGMHCVLRESRLFLGYKDGPLNTPFAAMAEDRARAALSKLKEQP